MNYWIQVNGLVVPFSQEKQKNVNNFICNTFSKFLDAGIQDVSTSISIVHDLREISPEDDDDDESDKHI